MGQKLIQHSNRRIRSSNFLTRSKEDESENPSDQSNDEMEDLESSYPPASNVNLPAHLTKHVAQIDYHFPVLQTSFQLTQRNDTNSTGSSLWLSSQVLASFLIHLYGSNHSTDITKTDDRLFPKNAIELGSGTGLLSLLLARLGWKVVATDVDPVLETVLRPNVSDAFYHLEKMTGRKDSVVVRELDWCVESHNWSWDSDGPSTSNSSSTFQTDSNSNPRTTTTKTPYFDLIVTADTIYQPTLLAPLFQVLSHLYYSHPYFSQTSQQPTSTLRRITKPTLLVALERRDDKAIDHALGLAKTDYNLALRQIPLRKVRKWFDTFGDGLHWKRQDWEGVEIWQL